MSELQSESVVTFRIVEYGIDLDNQRMDPEWIDAQIEAWMDRGGMVSAMFAMRLVAICDEVIHDEKGWFGTVRSLNEETNRLMNSGFYKGLGVGIKSAHVTLDDGVGVIDGGQVIAVSLLDQPMRYAADKP